DAALDEDLDAPHSCRGGICSTCLALITEGKAEMRKNQILTDPAVEEGYFLTWQAQPITPTLKVDYDDVSKLISLLTQQEIKSFQLQNLSEWFPLLSHNLPAFCFHKRK